MHTLAIIIVHLSNFYYSRCHSTIWLIIRDDLRICCRFFVTLFYLILFVAWVWNTCCLPVSSEPTLEEEQISIFWNEFTCVVTQSTWKSDLIRLNFSCAASEGFRTYLHDSLVARFLTKNIFQAQFNMGYIYTFWTCVHSETIDRVFTCSWIKFVVGYCEKIF